MNLRVVVTFFTYGLLGLAFVLGVAWFFMPDGGRWEPAVNSLTLIAGVTGVLVERLSAEAERRREILHAVTDEIEENARLLADERFSPPVAEAASMGSGGLSGSSRVRGSAGARQPRRQVYPRLIVSAVDLALVSGALANPKDSQLFTALHRWRDTVHEFNRRLDLTEINTFTAGASSEAVEWFQRALHREDSFLAAVRAEHERLRPLLDR